MGNTRGRLTVAEKIGLAILVAVLIAVIVGLIAISSMFVAHATGRSLGGIFTGMFLTYIITCLFLERSRG